MVGMPLNRSIWFLIACFLAVFASVQSGFAEEHSQRAQKNAVEAKLQEEKAIEHRFNVDGEGGEYETLVIGGPHMPGHLEVRGEVVWQGTRGTFEFTEVRPVVAH